MPWCLWGIAVAIGFGLLHRSMVAPGEAATAALVRPAGEVPLIVLIAHPECGCTTSAIEALGHATIGTSAAVQVVLSGDGLDAGWRASPNAKSALRFNHIELLHDPEGTIAARYGARTSGHTAMYARSGALRFSGGLSRGRGVVGPSTGLASLASVVAGQPPAASAADVYGCALFDASADGSLQ